MTVLMFNSSSVTNQQIYKHSIYLLSNYLDTETLTQKSEANNVII